MNIVTIHLGCFLIVRTTIKSGKAKDKVAKLSYEERGSFQIIQGI